jgi:hypothetical protein
VVAGEMIEETAAEVTEETAMAKKTSTRKASTSKKVEVAAEA